MARELAARRGASVTDAVRQALLAELARCPGTPGQRRRHGRMRSCSGSAAAANCPGPMGAAATSSRPSSMTKRDSQGGG
ncbi:MAG: type II toxin-antitoxin system VapB family antitoxin [Cyanobium sp.]